MLTTMNTKKYILFALAVLGLTTSCMKGDWDTPSIESGMTSYGNQDIKPTNLKTIAEVKALFATEIKNNSLKQVTTPMQIQGIVTGNDEGGNIYQNLYIQDNTDAIVISVAQGFLYGALPVGQAVLIELNDLFIGGYNNMAEIGSNSYVYDDGTLGLGKMNRFIWQSHYKLIPPIEGLNVTPMELKWNLNALDPEKDAGRLITLKGVEFAAANGTATFIKGNITSVDRELRSKTNNQLTSVIRGFKGLSTTQVFMTSAYADFANQVIPQGRVDITGVASLYRDTWQILVRKIKDVQPTSLSPDDVPPTATPAGSGTQADPYNVAAVDEYTKKLPADQQSSTDIYTTGIITTVSEIDTEGTYGNATYMISDVADGSTGTFQVYRGYGLNGDRFNKAGTTLIKAGDKVVIKGKVINYQGNTPQYAQGSTIVKLNDEGGEDTPPAPESNVTKSVEGSVLTLINTTATASTNKVTVDLNAQGWENAAEATPITLADGTIISFEKGENSNTPKFYSGTKGVRIYAKNFIKITGSTKAIAKVVLNCDSQGDTNYIGNDLLYGQADGLTMFIYNEYTGTSGGVQLRVKTIEITYAE